MKYLWNYFLILLLPVMAIASDDDVEEMMIIDSGQAEYNGKTIILDGHVIVEHDLGTLCANHMVLHPSRLEKKNRLSYMTLNDNVHIRLCDGGQLCCSQADVDYRTMTGKFKGDHQKEFAVYTENCRDSKGNTVPLIVKSRQMSVQLAEQSKAKGGSKNSLSYISADEQVTVNYNQDFIATADHATYQR